MLNISKQIYVGWNSATITEHLPEANIIPIGDSLQEKNKLEKFVFKHTDLEEYENVPLPGFTLYDVNKRNWSASDSSWLVIDPRGFMARITQKNMANILRVSGITEGLIQQRCVWAREDSDVTLSLVPVSSELYKEAVDNTEMIEARVDIKDVQIGDTVFLQNKMTGVYLGVMSLYASLVELNLNTGMKAQGMLRKQVIEVAPGKFYYHTDAKILKVTNKTLQPMSRDVAVSYVNNIINTDPTAYFSSYDVFGSRYYGARGRVKLVSTHAAPTINLSLQEVDITKAKEIYSSCLQYSDSGCLVLENARGKQFLIDFPWWGAGAIPKWDNFYVKAIEEVANDKILYKENIRSNKTPDGRSMFSLDNFAKFYKIVKSVKSDTYI
jgi:hypothetical protein